MKEGSLPLERVRGRADIIESTVVIGMDSEAQLLDGASLSTGWIESGSQ